ncbi:MAG: PAS domain-containing sensor histidine kinase [Aphanothece sp. CMT-3BRIN-NPC111]|jgi:PAS domain S-box-containing protein|nr:PAS domain-containing sensor histidine kinase [Aphanothece sp. CMT-3BRIN-NPC111]
MKDEDKTKEQLINELREMRQRLVELEKSENKLKQVENVLQQERNLVASLLDTTDSLIRNFVGAVLDVDNALIVVLDPQGRILNFNTTFEQMTYYSSAEVRGKYIWDLVAVSEDMEKVRATIKEIKADNNAKHIDCSWLMKDDLCRQISWSYMTIQAPNSSVDYILATGVDITDKKLAEAEIIDDLQKEKDLNQLKSRFVSIASHEYRTPLATIRMSSELLEKYSHKLSEERKYQEFNRIKAAVNRMSELIDDVLLITKAESRFQEFNPTNIDLEKVCGDLVEEIEQSTRSHHKIAFSNHCLSTKACMDERLLRHILTNLLSNAIKYSPKGSTVNFELACQDGEVIFKIKDPGIGIPIEDQQRLFEPFHRAKNVGKIPGTGLGLSIVKSLVDLHRGQINIESEIGVGTTFIVTLPLNSVVEINYKCVND